MDRTSEALGRLANAHSHVVLSSEAHPAAQYLQLLILPVVDKPPETHLGWLARAVDRGLIEDYGEEGKLAGLTRWGEVFARGLHGLPALAQQLPRAGQGSIPED